MSKLTLNFFDEEIMVDFPKNLKELRKKIADKFLFSQQDADETLINYINAKNEKVSIKSEKDFTIFQSTKINKVFLDISQDSEIYKESKNELECEKSKNQKELTELLVLYNKNKNEKQKEDEDRKKIEEGYLTQIKHLQKLHKKFVAEKVKIDAKFDKERKSMEKKIFDLQKKLNLPQTLDLPVACPSTEIILRRTKPKPAGGIIGISFDDGPVSGQPNSTGMRIINALANNGMKATFFYVSDWIKGSDGESEIKYAFQKGMEIANHTKSHPYLTNLNAGGIKDEVNGCHNRLKQIIGAEPAKLLRLPYLASNGTVQQALSDYALITCSIDTKDWSNASKDQIVGTIKGAISNGSADGAIVLCHETYASTAGAIEEIAPFCKQQGWKIDTISSMFASKGATLQRGQVNTKAGGGGGGWGWGY